MLLSVAGAAFLCLVSEAHASVISCPCMLPLSSTQSMHINVAERHGVYKRDYHAGCEANMNNIDARARIASTPNAPYISIKLCNIKTNFVFGNGIHNYTKVEVVHR